MERNLIYQSANSRILLQPESRWQRPVVVKILNAEFPSPRNIRHFFNEYDILRELDIPGVRRVLDMNRGQHQHSLTLEYVPGETLQALAQREPFPLECFLRIGEELARILGALHQLNVIHRDISGVNVLYDQAGGATHLIDFGIATRLSLRQQHLGNPEQLEGNLGYISPEQTGRMNRTVDYRTDLYSLGVTFYEMLTGVLPFSGADAMELVYAHLALPPPPLRQLRPDLPPVIEQIVDRLLAKNAEDRYQSAQGLGRDLTRCREQLSRDGVIESFPLTRQIQGDRFQLPQRLYGRDRELAHLLEAFERCAGGASETIFVGGYSGAGKSVLVREVHRPITRRRGYFAEGKFDQYQRAVPYSAFIQAFRELVALWLTENQDQLGRIRADILAAVGHEGQVLIEVIPRLELILGPQPPVPVLGGQEAQNRFNYVFRRFMQAVATAGHPLVLFIDDLQWADQASLHLLRVLMTAPESRYLLCVGAYRSNEVGPGHPFALTAAEMTAAGAVVHRIEIGNLTPADLEALAGDALHTTPERARPLAELIFEKTRGNAFFVNQFLLSLYQDELLHFDYGADAWQWDLAQIRDRNITDNVVELLSAKIRRLPPPTQEVLQLAAGIGNQFELPTLALVGDHTPADTEARLQPALAEGLISRDGETGRFAHDRIQQAVYSLIPEAERPAVHLRIGRLLLAHTPEAERADVLFDIVNQWNQGQDLLPAGEERLRLAELNLDAGRKAALAAAFPEALAYFRTGIGLLPADAWQRHYELMLALHTEAAETACLTGDFATTDRYLDTLLERAAGLLDRVPAFEVRIQAFIAQNKLGEAVRCGLECLRSLQLAFPPHPSLPQVVLGLLRSKVVLAGHSVEELARRPPMTDPLQQARMRLCMEIAPATYWVEPNLLPLVVFRMVGLSVRYGNAVESIFAYATYGLVLCDLGMIPAGYRFGEVALQVLDQRDARAILCRTRFVFYCFIQHWREPLAHSIQPFLDNYTAGLETGDIEYGSLSYYFFCQHGFYSGKPLDELDADMAACGDALGQLRQETPLHYLRIHHQAVRNLRGGPGAPHRLAGPLYDGEAMLAVHRQANDKTAIFKGHFLQMVLGYFFGEYEAAGQQARLAGQVLDGVTALHVKALYYYYDSLIKLARYSGQAATARRRTRRSVRGNLRKLRHWARQAPANSAHKAALVDGEFARVLGDESRARQAYERAIRGARDHGFLHEYALGHELAGRLALAHDADERAAFHLRRAFQAYREWGAAAKVRQLKDRYPDQLTDIGREAGATAGATLTGTTHGNRDSVRLDPSSLDLGSLLKASTAISGEIVLSRLLHTLMEIVLENAGARRGALLLNRGEQLFLEAESDLDARDIQVRQHKPLAAARNLPVAVINFVARTHENLVLARAADDARFQQDPYLRERQPGSILCLPILHQGALTGVLYLENNLTHSAFTPDRIEVLRLLSGQIAVSLANARMYETLEEAVEERTREVVRQKEELGRKHHETSELLDQLRATQSQLVQSEKMASLGLLTAGIAHEINNPINFVTSSVEALRIDFSELAELVGRYRSAAHTADPEAARRAADDYADRIGVDFLFQEVGELLNGVEEGARRTSDIVAGLRNFSRLDEDALKPADLHQGLDAALAMLAPLLENQIRVHRNYEPLPPVECVPGKINQVFMNLLTNAIHAIREAGPDRDPAGEIFITTRPLEQEVEIAIRDTGTGMEPFVLDRIFEPFFTTREVGKGAGLGLSISYGIIQQHQGNIRAESAPGAGATFTIRLPLRTQAQPRT